MINKQNNEKENVMTNTIVRIEKSGNRFNAYDANGVKYTSQITTGARKKAFNNNMALEQRVNKSGKNYWWAVPMDMYEATTRPVVPTSSVDVPVGHDEKTNKEIIKITIVKKYLFISLKSKLIFENASLFIKIFFGLLKERI